MRTPSFKVPTTGIMTQTKTRELSRAYGVVERLSDPHPAPGLRIDVGSHGTLFGLNAPPYFLARITGSSLNPSGQWAHSWVTVEEHLDGTKSDYQDGMVGTFDLTLSSWPAFEDNNTQTANDTYVWCRPGNGEWVEFSIGGGSELTTIVNNLTVNDTLTITYINDTISTTINNYGTGGNSKLRINASSSSAIITGFTAGLAGQLLIVWNVGAFPLVLAHESLLSLAANRILTPLGANYTVWPNAGIILEYDGVSQRWRFDDPTFGAGDAVLKTYACERLIFGTGLTYTDAGNGSGTVVVTNPAGTTISTTNQDATETTNPVSVIVCNNDLGAAKFARIHTTDVGAGVALFDWQGIQIYKSGTGLIGPEPDIELVSGTNITMTVVDDVANARIKVTIDAAAGISNLIFNEVALAASYTLTGAFANVGFPALTLPTIGKTYEVYASVSASLQTALAQGYVKIELWDATAGVRITNSTRAVLTCPAAAYLTEGSGEVRVVYVAPANNTSIQLFAKYITTGTFAAGQIIGADTNLGESVLGYVQLSY